ncbi:FAD:protein FMN transferase [Anaerobacillus sp. HL2]|nr:FAD:protein FMN transferase [Anaerobacillus sp. HL2]
MQLRVHHIIDQETLFPGAYYRGVTVIADDASVAEYLTTELFCCLMKRGLLLLIV